MATKKKSVGTKESVATNANKEKLFSAPAIPAAETPVKQIAERAFHLWQKRGCPTGDDQRDWYQAELEVSR